MSELHDFNQGVISEFRANHGKVGGQLATMPVLLLTTTGAKSGRALTRPLVYTTDGDRLFRSCTCSVRIIELDLSGDIHMK